MGDFLMVGIVIYPKLSQTREILFTCAEANSVGGCVCKTRTSNCYD